ncbi:MAG: hypothetical protein OWU33_10520 [Firmicutes bacterium]|nr:hypothetical protein [Bacillota bacterium]
MQITWHCLGCQAREQRISLLAWQYLLDIMLNDAYRAHLRHLEVYSRWDSWVAGRGIESSAPGSTEVPSDGIALLAVPWPVRAFTLSFQRAYVLSDGWVSPTSLGPGYQLDQQYFLGTWRAQLAGGLMRVGEVLRRPELVDRAVWRVRREFLSATPTLARYKLCVFRSRREGGGHESHQGGRAGCPTSS